MTHYVEVARFVGLDPYAMLKRARISPALLDDPDRRLARSAVNFLLTESAREANCISFGLMMAESRALASMGPITLLLKHQETARGVVEALGRYRHLMGDTITLTMEPHGPDEVAIVIRAVADKYTIERQGIELAMGIMCRAIVEVSGGRWRPSAVHFTHPAPDDPLVHKRVFGAPLVFNSSFNGYVSSNAALDIRFATAQHGMARHAESYLDSLAPAGVPASTVDQVRRSLGLLLPLGRGTLEQVSENIGMPSRTLQRLLEREEHSFASLLNTVRREVAVDQLEHSAFPLGEIGRMVGYATPSSFTRWFYAEFGLTPGSWRAGERPPDNGHGPGAPPAGRTSRGARTAA